MMKKQFLGRVLSRQEQKKINGGLAGCTLWLYCGTPYGGEYWRRSTVSGDATSACQSIYPAYGGGVYGSWELDCGVIQVVEVNQS